MKSLYSVVVFGCAFLTISITALAMLTNQFGWPMQLEMLSHFQMQYFMAALVLVAIALISKQTQLIGLSLFCAAMLSAQIIPWYFPIAAAEQPANYRVLSANLNVRNNNAAEILKFIEKEQPDLALLIEVNDSMAEKLEALKAFMPHSSNQAYPYQPGTVLYSKNPLTHVKIEKFNTNNAVNLTAHAQVNGQPISIVAIHPVPPLTKELLHSRNQVLAAVSDYVKQQSDRVLLVGDFNMTMWSPYYRLLVRQTGLKNARKGFGTLPTWPANTLYYLTPKLNALVKLIQIPIDQCLASPELTVTGMQVGPDLGSDHLPIVIDFSVDQG